MGTPARSTFGRRLRTLREKKRLSLSSVARTLGVSVVYYRDVERGTRRPFSSVKVDFDELAGVLGAEARELQRAAAEERGQLELDFRSADHDAQRLAVLFANCLSKRRLVKASLTRLRRLLERAS
jgi:transcriptional regulator with XRE-family HTH domain